MRCIMRSFLLFICLVVCPSLHCMEQVPNDIQKIIVSYVDYRMQRTLAQVDKAYNKLIEEHHRPCKKRIEDLMLEKKTPLIRGEVSWNKDFTRCAWVTIGTVPKDKNKWYLPERKSLCLSLVGLSDDGKIIEQYLLRNGFYFPAIEGNMRPFFDKDGNAFFHSYADVLIGPDYCREMTTSIIKFTISIKGGISTNRCFIGLKENDYKGYDFYYILNFPVLLKALLQSKKMKTHGRRLEDGYDEAAKYYDISGVIIPEDYKTYKERSFFKDNEGAREKYIDTLAHTHNICRLDYIGLPKELRNVIDERYAEQQCEKKMIEDMV
jgi:hypothetical protein